MRSPWTVAACLLAAAALVGIAVGVTYLTVDAGSLPAALGRVAGSTARRTERGFFALMVGGLLLLLAVLSSQLRPGGALAGGQADAGQRTGRAGGGDGRPGDSQPPVGDGS